MTAVALQSKVKDHHPEWSNVSNEPYILLITRVEYAAGRFPLLDSAAYYREVID